LGRLSLNKLSAINYQQYIEALKDGLTVDATLPHQAEQLRATILNQDLSVFKGVQQSLKVEIEQASKSSSTAAAKIPTLTRQMRQLEELGKALSQIKSQKETPSALESVKKQIFAFCEQNMTLSEIEQTLAATQDFLAQQEQYQSQEDILVWWRSFRPEVRNYLSGQFKISAKPTAADLVKCKEALANGALFQREKEVHLKAAFHSPIEIFLPSVSSLGFKPLLLQDYVSADLSALQVFPQIPQLRLYNLSQSNWALLKNLPIKDLTINRCNAIGLDNLKTLPLQFLSILDTPLSGLEQLNKFAGLKHLFVSYTSLSAIELSNSFIYQPVNIGLFVSVQVLQQQFGQLGNLLLQKWQHSKQDRFLPAQVALWQLSNVFVNPYFFTHLPVSLQNFLQNNPNIRLSLFVEESLLHLKSHMYVK
jgi:hypothetical protein